MKKNLIVNTEKTATPQTLAWNIFSNGAFEIFGELKDEMKDGKTFF